MSSFYGRSIFSEGGSSDTPKIYSKTTQQWITENPISEKNTFYVFTDFKIEEGVKIPGLKLGDGNAYVIDLPFIASDAQDMEEIFEHIRNMKIHVSNEDRSNWNSVNDKISAHISEVDQEELIFTF